MNNKAIKLILLSFLFPFLLTGCNLESIFGKNDISQQEIMKKYQIEKLNKEIEDKYQIFAENIKENGQLLIKLKKESEKSPEPKIIENIDPKIPKDLENLTTATNSLKAIVVDDNNIESLLMLIKIPNDATEGETKDPNIASIIKLFEDGKLDEKEICENIQIPLGVVQNKNDNDCGNFTDKTYDNLATFFSEKNKQIEDHIKTINKSVNSENLVDINDNKNQGNKLVLILIITGSVLGLVVTILSIINTLLIRDLKKKNGELLRVIKHQKNAMEEFEGKDQYLNQQIKILQDKVNELNTFSQTQFSIVQQQFRQLEFQINNPPSVNDSDRDATSLQQQYSNTIHKETPPPPPPMSEDVRLINLYRENPQGLLKNAIRVSMTKDTVNKVLAGTWEGLVELENNNRQGEYYIVASNSNNGDFYLFLDPHTPFNSQTLQQIKKSQLFICNGNLSQTLKGNQISIIKPAIVKQNTKNKWALVQSGEIDLVN